MKFKFLAALVAVALMFAYLLPPAIKLKEFALALVIGIGLALMLVDLWQSLKSKED